MRLVYRVVGNEWRVASALMRSGQRHFFPAVTWSVMLVGAVALAGSTLRRFIPKPTLNAMESEQEPFLRAGSTQPIPWRNLNRESLTEARREGRPILLLIGRATSHSANLMDRFALPDTELADAIRRGFVAVRVDAVAEPYLAAAYDPIRRPLDNWDTSCQVWYLDSDGRPYGNLLALSPDPNVMGRNLAGSVAYNLDVHARIKDHPAGASQFKQVRSLLEPSSDTPLIGRHAQDLIATMDKASCAWPAPFGLRLQPAPIAFLAETMPIDAARALEAIASSSMVDWVNGGFFTCARERNWRSPDFEKSAVLNAAMTDIYAQFGDNPLYRRLSEDAFDCLMSDFRQNGLIVGHRYGDRVNNRSEKSSFSVRFLGQNLDRKVRDASVRLLNLDPGTNPTMLPRVNGTEVYRTHEPEIESTLKALRTAKQGVEQQFTGQVTASIHGYVTARLLSAARLFGDRKHRNDANSIFETLMAFRTGENDVLRRPKTDIQAACLSDYLAYADAALQSALLNNSPERAADGAAVLRRALVFFKLDEGVLSLASPEVSSDLPPGAMTPEIVDGEIESSSAMAIRLAMQYAWYSESVLGRGADDLRAFAKTSTRHFAKTANEIRIGYSGYFHAAGMVQQDRYVVVHGGDAGSVLRRIPTQFVVELPSTGPMKLEVVIGGKAISFPSIEAIIEAFPHQP